MLVRTLPLIATFFACASTPTAARQGLWQIRDTRLFVRDVGPEDAPVLLVLHGGPGGNHQSLRPLERFAPQYRVVLYDQRGSGASDRLGGPSALDRLTLEQNIEDLEALRVKLGRERISIIGHSFGGALAIFYAAAHPEHVDKLIVYSGGPEDQTLAGEKRTAHMARMNEEEKAAFRTRIQALQVAAEKGAREGELDELFLDVAELMFPSLYCERPAKSSAEKGRAGFWASQAVNAYLDSFDRAAFSEQLERIDRPVLLTWGRCEPSPQERLLYLLDHLPDARLVIFEKSGHNAMEEEPDLFFATVSAFLAGDELPDRSYRHRQELPQK